ncbi:MAG: hypothetical protein LBR26_15960 [Prevotella sp.]|jgi:hypothetical protein|nr:hypothetical protein [Prevotella sp.]
MERINKESVSEILAESKDGLHVKDITTHLINKYSNDLFNQSEHLDYEKVLKRVNGILANDVKKGINSIFSKVKNPKTKKDKKGEYKLKQKRNAGGIDILPVSPEPEVKPETPKQPTTYIGKAGECAVMSELLFRGYNVNSMLVDDGVDIVATKNNIFYYLQVKTTTVKDNSKIYTRITQKRFNDFIGNQIRYVIVARCILNNIENNLYFILNNDNIQKFIYEKKVKQSEDGIYIKIEIDAKDKKPYIYDEKRECIEFFMNRFEL